MFEPGAESVVLEIVCGIFDITPEEMMKTGDLTKKLFFNPEAQDEEAAKEQIKAALSDMPQEHALLAGVFFSGLLRCNLFHQAEQQSAQEMAEGCRGCWQENDSE
ncbi:MAG: hypothetical protein HPY61_13255 [Methanotrichaceae archaeon]|nr:hypothetical protein [Methanotrichaceae archaeon]